MSDTHRAKRGSVLEDLSQYGEHDFVLITGVLYPHYLGQSQNFVNRNISKALKPGGYIISVHIAEMHPFSTYFTEIDSWTYRYREYTHDLVVQRKHS
jgi:2-polyprenyl-3-methyl-5-hydroxy-6-metoxy-1,4-benzoquinol methylase